MRKRHVLALIAAITWLSPMVVYGQTVQWIRQFGSRGLDSADGVVTDGDGSIYISGTTSRQPKDPLEKRPLGGFDAFAAKYTRDGQQVWMKQLGSVYSDYYTGIDLDAQGNVFVAGMTRGNIDGDSRRPDDNKHDAFLCKYDGKGELIWIRQFGTGKATYARGVAADSRGNVFVTGSMCCKHRHPKSGKRTSDSISYIRKYDGEGKLLWARQFGGSSGDSAWSIVTDAQGNAYVGGSTNGKLDSSKANQHAGGFDAFIRKFDSDGDIVWSRQSGTSDNDFIEDVAIDRHGSAYATGYTFGKFGGKKAPSQSSERDAFVMKYDHQGQLIWVKQFGSIADDGGQAITAHTNDRIYVAGYTRGDIDGPGLGKHAGYFDAFVASFRDDGTPLWTKQFGIAKNDDVHGIATDSVGDIIVVGATQGDIDDDGPNVSSSSRNGATDVFVMKLRDTAKKSDGKINE